MEGASCILRVSEDGSALLVLPARAMALIYRLGHSGGCL